jgi:hypothetical protein
VSLLTIGASHINNFVLIDFLVSMFFPLTSKLFLDLFLLYCYPNYFITICIPMYFVNQIIKEQVLTGCRLTLLWPFSFKMDYIILVLPL